MSFRPVSGADYDGDCGALIGFRPFVELVANPWLSVVSRSMFALISKINWLPKDFV